MAKYKIYRNEGFEFKPTTYVTYKGIPFTKGRTTIDGKEVYYTFWENFYQRKNKYIFFCDLSGKIINNKENSCMCLQINNEFKVYRCNKRHFLRLGIAEVIKKLMKNENQKNNGFTFDYNLGWFIS